jgi:hypothetical protein
MNNLTLNNGVVMPALGFSVFQNPPDETRIAVETALSAGYRHIVAAAAYFSEPQVGEAIAASGVPRDELFLQTSLWISDYGYEKPCTASRRALANWESIRSTSSSSTSRCRPRSIARWRPTVHWRRCWPTAGSGPSVSATSWRTP